MCPKTGKAGGAGTKTKEKGLPLRGKLQARRGFTLIELMVALAIMLILAHPGGGRAGSVCAAQPFCPQRSQRAHGLPGCAAGAGPPGGGRRAGRLAGRGGRCGRDRRLTAPPDGAGAAAEAAAYPDRVRVLFYDKADPGTAAGRLAAQLLEPYIYDAALLNASLALEIDMQTGKVFSVFYDSEAARLRFGAQPNATDITDRSAAHRRAHRPGRVLCAGSCAEQRAAAAGRTAHPGCGRLSTARRWR